MPTHDWKRVDVDIFHDFHTVWIGNLRTALNEALLPEGYYALAEQHAGRVITDVLTLHASPAPLEALPVEPAALARRRSLAIRHVTGHRLVALVEIVSPANKDRARHVEDFAAKAVSALEVGVHLLLVDLFPPGSHDPAGMHGVILQRLQESDEPYDLPADEPLTLASYASGPCVEIYVEHLAVGAVLPDMPLFLRPDRYVNVPLESTYQAAYRGLPAFWRAILEGPPPSL
jgi:hypothetical protein